MGCQLGYGYAGMLTDVAVVVATNKSRSKSGTLQDVSFRVDL